MKILSKNFRSLYSGESYFVIPPYQRSITWPEDQWNYLYKDVINLVENNKESNHLFQIFQFRQEMTDDGSRHEVGDGQQRLLHSSLLLAGLAFAITDILCDKHAPEKEANSLKDIVKEILGYYPDEGSKPHKVVSSLLTMGSRGKILPRIVLKKSVQENYLKIIEGEITLSGIDTTNIDNGFEESLVLDAFRFYGSSLSKYLAPKKFSDIVTAAEGILHAVTEKIVFAAAYFDSVEIMQSSYEATNSRGIALTESELIKNHIFKSFRISDQERQAEEWKPLEENHWFSTSDYARAIKGSINSTYARKDEVEKVFKIHNRAISGKGVITKASTYPIFHDFKAHHDEVTGKMKSNEVCSYYENLIKELVSLSEVYRQILRRYYDEVKDFRGNLIETKQHTYVTAYHRLVEGAGISQEDFFTLIFILEMKAYGMSGWQEYKIEGDQYQIAVIIRDYVRVVESYIIRKLLGGDNTATEAINKVIGIFQKKKGLTPEGLYNYLVIQQGKRVSFEGTEDILRKHSNPIPMKESLGKNLNFDYDALIKSDKKDPVIMYMGKQTLEHFMPQSSKNYERDWPIPESQEPYRNNLIASFGNFAQISDELNNRLSNKSYKQKLEILQSHYKGDAKTIQNILDSKKWDKEEISKYGKDKLKVLLSYYSGPSNTIKSYPLSIPVSLGKIKVGDTIYCQSKSGDLIELYVGEEGKIDYNGISYETEKALKVAIYGPEVRGNLIRILIKNGQQNITIRNFINKLEEEVEA